MEIELFLALSAGAKWAEGEGSVQERHLGRKMRHGRAVEEMAEEWHHWNYTVPVLQGGMSLSFVYALFGYIFLDKTPEWSMAEMNSTAEWRCKPRGGTKVFSSCSITPQAWFKTEGLGVLLRTLTPGTALGLRVACLHGPLPLALAAVGFLVGWVAGPLCCWHPAGTPDVGVAIWEYPGWFFLACCS